MIDEELYKRATDELDSDARKPDVWARACALASDDHDEARFLYTNLRVEEMLNKDGKQRTFSNDRHRRDLDLSDAQKLDSLELPDSVEAVAASSRTGVSNDDSPLPTLELEPTDGELEKPISSVAGTNELATEAAPFDDETMAELESLTKSNASDDVALSGITGKAITTAQHIENPSTNDIVSEVFGASAASARAKVLSPEEQKTTELAHKLERQAQDTLDEADNDGTAELMDETVAVESVPNAHQEDSQAVGVRTDYADSSELLDADGTLELEHELDTGVGRSFMVFSRGGVVKAIKRGVSWPALFFTFPWLLSKALFGTAIVYGFLWLVSLAGLYTTGSAWLDAGAQASLGIKLWTAAFAALAIIGLLYIPFRYGNRWVAEKLQNRGFEFEASVSAGSKRDAVDRLLEANQ